MSKKRRSMLLNLCISLVIIVSSFFVMGAYDQACDGTKYSEIVFDLNDFEGFETKDDGSIVVIEQGTEVSIPIKVIIKMEPDYSLESVYGDNYDNAEISIESFFDEEGISISSTERTDSTDTKSTLGAEYTLTADLILSDTLESGSYTIPLRFSIYNNVSLKEFEVAENVHVEITEEDEEIPLVIETTRLKDGTVGVSYSDTVEASGGTAPYTWITAGLPNGLSLNFHTGEINGTPTEVNEYDILLQVFDSTPDTAAKHVKLNINSQLIITSTKLESGTEGASYSDTVEASGGTAPYTWSASGLPDGLSLDPDAGEINGTPTEAGAFDVLLQVTDSTSAVAEKSLTLTVSSQLVITSTRLESGRVGSSYSDTIEASGGTAPYTWSASGLPDGLSLNPDTGVISGRPTESGTSIVSFTATDSNMIEISKDLNLRIRPKQHDSEPSPSKPAPILENTQADVLDNSGNLLETTTVYFDKSTRIASINLTNDVYANVVANKEGIKVVIIEVPEIVGADGYNATLPVGFWTSGNGKKAIEISTSKGTVTIPDNMLNIADASSAKNLSLMIASVDKSKLNQTVQAQVGDRPIIDISLIIDGKQIEWSNENVPVTISIPYNPTAIESKNPENITVWYIDGSGNIVSIPRGKYNQETGCVTFKTTHFSKYAVAFVQKTFNDISNYTWAKNKIEILASKGILSGTTDTTFDPSGNITRAEFVVSLIKTLGLSAKAEDNFRDVKPEAGYFEAVGIAKKLGIVKGSGKNLFNPEQPLSKQDMIVLTERALSVLNHNSEMNLANNLSSFTDKDQISEYAKRSTLILVNYGLIKDSNGKIYPLSNVTRAEAAEFLYEIYNKY